MSTTCSAPIQLEKPASHSYQPPSTHGSSAVDIVFIHGLHRRSTKAERQLCDYARTTSAQERPVVYDMAVDNLSCNENASGYLHTSRAALDLLSKVASERERRQRTTARIIFVAEGPGCNILSQALHLANHSSKEKTTDANKAILTSTYGVISLPAPRRLRLPTTLLLTTSQLICHKILSNYETHRTFGSIDSPPTSTLTPLPQLLENPPTSLFVGTSFAYGILATIQYHINSTDRLQRHFVFVGVLIGIYTASPSLANLDQHKPLVLASPLALNIIVAMAVSTCGHWIWRIVFSTRKARLDCMIGEWEREAREMEKDMGAHVIRFHELD